MDMIQGGNRMVFVLEGTVENFSQIFFHRKFPNFFVLKGKFLFFLIEGIIPHCGRVEEGKSIWSGASFFNYILFRFDRMVLTGHWHFS